MYHRVLFVALLGLSLATCGCDAVALVGAATGEVEHRHVRIDLSPDGRTVVLSSADGDLYLFDLASRKAKRLTDTKRIESYPSFSPDGDRIVYSAAEDKDAPWHIFELEISTRIVTQLTGEVARADYFPRYSPDGKEIVFARAHLHRPYSLGGWTWDDWDICKMAADGTAVSRLTHEKYYQLSRVIPRSDGSVVYGADRGEGAPPFALYSVSPEKDPRQQIPGAGKFDSDVHAWAIDPMVSSDGKRIVFCSDRKEAFWYDVAVAERDGGDVDLLIGEESRYNICPDFFPDNNHVLFLAGKEINAHGRAIYSLWKVSLMGEIEEIAPSDLFTNPENWLQERKNSPEKRADADESVP